MATANASRSVSISREQRDALHCEIREYVLHPDPFGDLHSELERGHGAEAREYWVRMALGARLLDQIGWDKQADRDVYTIAIDDDLVGFVRWRDEQTQGCLAEHAGVVAEVRDGKDPWAHPGYPREGSLEEDVAFARSQADRDLEVVAACHAILDQVDR